MSNIIDSPAKPLELPFAVQNEALKQDPAASAPVQQQDQVSEERKAAAEYLKQLVGWLKDPRELKKQAALARQVLEDAGMSAGGVAKE